VIGDLTVDATATSLSLLAEDLEDFADPAISFHAQPLGGDPTTDQWVEPIGFTHAPVVPMSRGAACAITDPIEVSFPAGDCPLTDGVPGAAACGDGCAATEGIVDLGAVVPIRRIRVIGWGGRVAISSDGVDYTVVTEGAELPQPTTARYVWSYDATSLGEISVFAP
jgi:hypothetical protein